MSALAADYRDRSAGSGQPGVVRRSGSFRSGIGIAGLVTFAAMAPVSFAAPFSDSFAGNTLNPGWTVVTANPADSAVLTGANQLQIAASPLNGGSDLYGGSNFNAPVILQSIDPSLDWTIETVVAFNPTSNYQGAGIILGTTTSPFTSYGQFSRVAQREFYPSDGGNAVENEPSSEYISFTGTTTWLQVQKIGDTYTTYASADGNVWTEVGQDTDTTAYTEIGLFADRQAWDNDLTVSSVADFGFFDVTVDASVPEPASLPIFLAGLLGCAWIGGRRAPPKQSIGATA